MKYVLVIYEGAADLPSDELEGSTPLQLARNIHATALVRRGVGGYLLWPADHAGTTAPEMTGIVLGIASEEAKTMVRGPVEGAPGNGYCYRGNFVTCDGSEVRESRVTGLSLDETTWLVDSLADVAKSHGATITITGRGRVAVRFDKAETASDAGEFPAPGVRLPEDGDTLSARAKFMRAAAECLARQSINDVRVDLGENPANALWLWAGGPSAKISRPFIGAPLISAMVTNSPLGRGIGTLCRMTVKHLGDVWADSVQPELIGVDELADVMARHEITVVYVEAPLEGGRFGEGVEKVKALDRLDIHVLSRITQAVECIPDTRIMLVAMPEEGQLMEQIPVALAGNNVSPDKVGRWDEVSCHGGGLGRLPAHRCISKLLGD
ncbi:MAG TPA: hypothetical protein PJ991_00920 [Kiritimatiellia bacterium]|nr:hypothetical protein [Kiritimatiellia bacterium]